MRHDTDPVPGATLNLIVLRHFFHQGKLYLVLFLSFFLFFFFERCATKAALFSEASGANSGV